MHVSATLLAMYYCNTTQHFVAHDVRTGTRILFVYDDCGKFIKSNPKDLMSELKSIVDSVDPTLVTTRVLSEAAQQIMLSKDIVRIEDVDGNESIINFRNGVLSFGGEVPTLKPHSPEYLSTIQVDCNWTGEAQSTPVFNEFMDRLCDGNKMVEALLLAYMGMTISNVKGYRMKKALILVGAGNTGKSQLLMLMQRLLGQGNYATVSLHDLETRFGASSLYSVRLAGDGDMPFQAIPELRVFKCLTGGDAIRVEYKGENAFSWVYGGVLMFCANQYPRFSGDLGKWVYDRLMIVPCNNVVPEAEQDKDLLNKMFAEREGIVYRAVMALRDFVAAGYRFDEPECVQQARELCKASNDSVCGFATSCLVRRTDSISAEDTITVKTIYTAYCSWCKEHRLNPRPTSDYRKGLAAHYGYDSYRNMTVERAHGTYLADYMLSLEAAEDYLRR